jgi:hypothetical protein
MLYCKVQGTILERQPGVERAAGTLTNLYQIAASACGPPSITVLHPKMD